MGCFAAAGQRARARNDKDKTDPVRPGRGQKRALRALEPNCPGARAQRSERKHELNPQHTPKQAGAFNGPASQNPKASWQKLSWQDPEVPANRLGNRLRIAAPGGWRFSSPAQCERLLIPLAALPRGEFS